MNQLEKNAIADLGDTLLGTLDEILKELKAINTKLGVPNSQMAKVEVKTSTRGTDIDVAAYEFTDKDALTHAGDLATDEYRRVMSKLSADVMNGFVAEASKAR